MTFTIEYSDTRYRLILISPNGEEDYLEPVLYCSPSSVVGPDGRVYCAYLNGSEPELDMLSNHPTDITMVATGIKVYDLTDGLDRPKKLDSLVTIAETEFDDEEDEDGEGDEEEDHEPADVIDVKPV